MEPIEKTLFLKSLELANEADRLEFLDRNCGGDIQLQHRVIDLIKCHLDDSSHIIDQRLFDTGFSDLSQLPEYEAGTFIGRYRLVRRIGLGGMGEVWEARQSQPIERKVALKIVRVGLETPGVVRRFEAERQVLARLDHPGISSILDAGATKNGQPFFVMDLIDGVMLHKFVEHQSPNMRTRAELFKKMVLAVQHAHQRGVIHRDLKPANVLVSTVSGEPVPVIIDFGLAKILSGFPRMGSGLTHYGVLAGTIDYMSPEQTRFAEQAADTRSDIYSLGVILYELICGSRPFESFGFSNLDFESKVSMIRNQVPPRPSQQASQNSASPRSTGNGAIGIERVFRDELDWIALKALEKEPRDRYQTAMDFAVDIENYLTGNRVVAHPPSNWYLLRKFLRRNRGLALTGLAVFTSLLVGLVAVSFGLYLSNKSANEAIQRQREVELANREANLQAAEARREQQYSEAIANYLRDDILKLTTIDGQYMSDADEMLTGHETTLGQLLERAKIGLRKNEELNPSAKSELLRIIGLSYRIEGKVDEAIEILRDSLETAQNHCPDQTEQILNCANSLAVALSEGGQVQEAAELREKMLAISQQEKWVLHPTLLALQRGLAMNYLKLGDAEAAQQILEPMLDDLELSLGLDDSETIKTRINLAVLYKSQGRLDDAIEHYEMSLRDAGGAKGPRHPITIGCLYSYTDALVEKGNVKRAETLLKKTLKMHRETYPPGHSRILESLSWLGLCYWKSGQPNKAIPIFKEVVESQSKNLGRQHRETLRTKANLAINYYENEQFDEALRLFKEVFASSELSEFELEFAWEAYRQTLARRGTKAEFRRLVHDQAKMFERRYLKAPEKLARFYVDVGNDAMRIPDAQFAETWFRRTLSIQQDEIPEHWHTTATMKLLGSNLLFQGKTDEAGPLLEQAFTRYRQHMEEFADDLEMHREMVRRAFSTLSRLRQHAASSNRPDELEKWIGVAEKLKLELPENLRSW